MTLAEQRDELLLAFNSARNTDPGTLVKQQVLGKIATYYDGLIVEDLVNGGKFRAILENGKELALKVFYHRMDDESETSRKERLQETYDRVRRDYHWVYPRTPNSARIAARILRDRGDPKDSIKIAETVVVTKVV